MTAEKTGGVAYNNTGEVGMCFKHKTILAVLSVALLFSSQAHAASFSGKLVKVIDGGLVEVLHDDKAEPVRLARIDAPEKDQPFWKVAADFVSEIAAHKMVTVHFENYDLYGRPVAEVFLPDGGSLNKLIVKAGYAWAYAGNGYGNDPDYAELEASARSARLGLWQDANPVPPWEWQWVQRQLLKYGSSFSCSDKKYCREMTSCEEAKLYMYACGMKRLDPDNDGVPCDAKCK